MVPARHSSRSERAVDGPRIPEDLSPLEVEGLEDDEAWDQCEVRGSCVGAETTVLEVSESIVRSVDFTGARIERMHVADSVFDLCDLSGVMLDRARFERVQFRSCRLLGMVAPGSQMRGVRFVDCQLDQANLRMCSGERVTFDTTRMRATDLYEADLAEARFFDCDLSTAQFSKVRLPGARFHGSNLQTVRGADSLRGIIIDSTQVFPLALSVFGGLGIVVDDERETPSG